ncbi:MAG: TIGR03790 family protein [Phycisphaerales bacterium]|nr:MAG: TIGR03790 family protein [Phycisphaerales bacterium]
MGMRSLLSAVLVSAIGTGASVALGVDPSARTADMPDSWLVLYNLNNPDSIAWAEWYREQRSIPLENFLGLDASNQEHLPNLNAASGQILNPVEDFFEAHPDIEERIMGIVLGFGLPSHFGNPPVIPDVGGFSVANALQDMADTTIWEANLDCPHMLPPYGMLPPGGRLTKATMRAQHYMVAQIDGPTLEEAKQLTLRAKAIENSCHFFGDDEVVAFDYLDPVMPGDEWIWLQRAVDHEDLQDVPWESFDADTEQSPNDAFRFGTHDVDGWDDGRLYGEPAGSRALAFNLNSWGATTIRSCTEENGRYVPNALAAGYAAAIGATGEPQCCVCPFPDTLMAALREGWTLGEAFYLANPHDDWMYTIVGDPLLTIPRWFSEEPPLRGDVNCDSMINLRDLAGFAACIKGPGRTVHPVCNPFDFDEDEDCDLLDFRAFQQNYTGGPLTPATGDYDGNGIVDLSDFNTFQNCATVPGPTTVADVCDDVFDFDFDLDIDLEDFFRMQHVLVPREPQPAPEQSLQSQQPLHP